jgi:hypothetical protein
MSRKELQELEDRVVERLNNGNFHKDKDYISISINAGYDIHGLPETKIDVIVNPKHPNPKIMEQIRNEIMNVVFAQNINLDENEQIPYPFVRFYSPNKESYVY